ncbi:MAG: metal ABC transporter substrate-binding protein [Lachnospiraceae bacterium]
MKNITAIFMALILLVLPLAGCGAQEAPEGEGLSVVATVFAPYDFARQLVGERGEVTLLLPPGSEAHSYEPTPKDIIDIQNCDLFIYVGGISDAWVADVR